MKRVGIGFNRLKLQSRCVSCENWNELLESINGEEPLDKRSDSSCLKEIVLRAVFVIM
jgi:predicted ATP-dependent serine protease